MHSISSDSPQTGGPSRLPSTRARSGSGTLPGQSRNQGEAEVALPVRIWHTSGSMVASALAKTPLVRQKLSKRSSSQVKFDIGPPATHDRAISLKHAAPSWLREKPSKTRLTSPNSSGSSGGQWRRATVLFRDNGVITVLNEDRSLLHSIQCASLSATDIRVIDDSLFGIPNVLGIFSKSSIFTPTSASLRSAMGTPLAELAKQDPIFLEFPSVAKLKYCQALLRIYAQPEVYGPSSSASSGGTHRRIRQIDITIFEAKSIMPKLPVDSNPVPQNYQSLRAANAYGIDSTVDVSADHPRASLDFDESMARAQAALDEKMAKEAKTSAEDSAPTQETEILVTEKNVTEPDVFSSVDQASEPDNNGRLSRAESVNDSASQTADDVSSVEEQMSGPVSGLSGSARFTQPSAPSLLASGGPLPTSVKPPLSRRQDKDLYTSSSFDRYCRVILNGELVARTRPRLTGGDAFNVEKFRLTDLSDVQSLTVEVMHGTQKTGISTATGQASISQKYVLLGIVEVPIDSLRRGEEIEGRFPIWSTSTIQTVNGPDGEGKATSTYSKGLVGELKMSIRVREDTVLPLHMYDEVERRLQDSDAPELVFGLSRQLSEDTVIPHLIDIWAASGTITERIAAIADMESVTWGDRLEPELLFRANTLLSRSVDRFQRLLAFSWLEDCVGPTVKAVCEEMRPAVVANEFPDRPDGNADYSALAKSPVLGTTGTAYSTFDLPMTVDRLRKLCETLWENIYSHRHECPADLRTVLSDIRAKVNARYRRSTSTKPGIQGVGAFIFLRLFCAALNAPQLYGLTPAQPSRASQRKLLLLSKVLLALANKKPSFDKDKDRELLPLNDFLKTYSAAFDDYITVVSTKPPTKAETKLLGISYEDDQDLQRAARRKLASLAPLHRESIPTAPYMLDKAAALASFVSFIVRAAEECEYEARDVLSEDELVGHDKESSVSGIMALKRKRSEIERRVDNMIDLCCDIEDKVGILIEQAGFNPKPLRTVKTRLTLLRSGEVRPVSSVVTAGKDAGPSPRSLHGETGDASFSSLASSTSSFATVLGEGDTVARYTPSPSSSSNGQRSRRATITAAAFRSPPRDQEFTVVRDDGRIASPSGESDRSMLQGSPMRRGSSSGGYDESFFQRNRLFRAEASTAEDDSFDDELGRAYRDLRRQEAQASAHEKVANYVASLEVPNRRESPRNEDGSTESAAQTPRLQQTETVESSKGGDFGSPRRLGTRSSFVTPKSANNTANTMTSRRHSSDLARLARPTRNLGETPEEVQNNPIPSGMPAGAVGKMIGASVEKKKKWWNRS